MAAPPTPLEDRFDTYAIGGLFEGKRVNAIAAGERVDGANKVGIELIESAPVGNDEVVAGTRMNGFGEIIGLLSGRKTDGIIAAAGGKHAQRLHILEAIAAGERCARCSALR